MIRATNSFSIEINIQLQERITKNLKNFSVRKNKRLKAKRAAVAVTVIDAGHGTTVYGMNNFAHWSNKAALILTQRASRLKNHAGQWAFPGGRVDAGETVEETALRELSEEVGLNLEPNRIIGALDDFVTRSGFVITPIVIWGGACDGLEPNPSEVEAIHRIPINEFLRNDAPILENITESDNPILLMPVGFGWIAAPTAAIIYQFVEVGILNRQTRVAHFEQPMFAWQ